MNQNPHLRSRLVESIETMDVEYQPGWQAGSLIDAALNHLRHMMIANGRVYVDHEFVAQFAEVEPSEPSDTEILDRLENRDSHVMTLERSCVAGGVSLRRIIRELIRSERG